jgi:hypothetical protein
MMARKMVARRLNEKKRKKKTSQNSVWIIFNNGFETKLNNSCSMFFFGAGRVEDERFVVFFMDIYCVSIRKNVI